MGHYMVNNMKGCDLCNHTKTFLTSMARKLMPNHVPDCCWQVISVNLIMELQCYGAIMVVVDCLSKWAHVIPTTSDVMDSGVAWLIRDHMWKLHSLLEEVICYWGTQFISSLTFSLSQLLGIWAAACTAYHLQTAMSCTTIMTPADKLQLALIHGSHPSHTHTTSAPTHTTSNPDPILPVIVESHVSCYVLIPLVC